MFFGLLFLGQPSSSTETPNSLSSAHTIVLPFASLHRHGNHDFTGHDNFLPQADNNNSNRKLKDTEAEKAQEEAEKQEEDRLKEEAKAQEEQLKDEQDANKDAFEAQQRQLWLVHGALMALSWGVLVPCAIGSSLLRAIIGGPLWFQIHQYTQMLAFLTTTAGFGIAVYNVQREDEGGSSPDEHFDEGHKAIGLSIFVLVVAQMLSGIFRPHLPPPPSPPPSDSNQDDDDNDKKMVRADGAKDGQVNGGKDPTATKGSLTSNDNDNNDNEIKQATPEPTLNTQQKSMARRFFEVQHRVLGATLVVLAWINCTIGIRKVFDDDDDEIEQGGGGGSSSTTVLAIFWAIAGGITVVVISLRLLIQLNIIPAGGK